MPANGRWDLIRRLKVNIDTNICVCSNDRRCTTMSSLNPSYERKKWKLFSIQRPPISEKKKKNCFSEFSQVSPFCFSGKGNDEIEMNVRCWWNKLTGGNESTRRKNCPNATFFYNKSHIDLDSNTASDVISKICIQGYS